MKKYNKSIVAKIFTTFLLACVAISLSLYISRFTFTTILSTVDQLSRPNTKIQLVNDLFRDVVKLDLLQRNEALKTQPSQYTPFLKESRSIQLKLDSLRAMSLDNHIRVLQIDSMKKMLYKRDLFFLKYVQLRADLVKNDTIGRQVENLSSLINQLRIDSNLVTTSRATKITIDTLKQEEEKQSLWNRIFAKKKPKTKQVQKQVEEVLNVRVDTLELGNNRDSLAKIGKTITQAELARAARRNLVISRKTDLNHINDVLIAKLLSVLNDIETDELAHAGQKNTFANDMVNKSIEHVNAVLIIFILATAILILFILTDISKSNQYRRELIIAKEEAEEAGMAKQRFLANMSHELRTPLQTIIGISEQIRESDNPRPQDLENVYQSSMYLLQIVNEVLDYSRIISGKYVLESKPFKMRQLLDEVIEMIQVQFALKNLSFEYKLNVSKSNFYSGDPFRLKQILLNLLGNAAKFTDEGSVLMSVNEDIQPDGISSFTFKIEDTGVGIAPADIAVIFNQFEQGSNIHKKQGTGLGLTIVKALVDIQHGSMQVQSEPGKGTTFTVTIPYSKTENIATVYLDIPSVTKNYNGHVWVIDDDLFILQRYDYILNKHGIPHTCFSQPQEALTPPFPPDLKFVFLDIRMPGMDGITLHGKLKERSVLKSPLYIALTAQAMPYERDALLLNGFDDVLMKPFVEQDIINVIYKSSADPENDMHLSLDLSSVYKMTGDNAEMLDMTLQTFVIETEKDIAAANQSIRNNDGNGLADALHKLAGRCGQLGVTSLAQDLRRMEIALYGGKNVADVKEKMAEADMHLAAVLKTLQDFRSKKNAPTQC